MCIEYQSLITPYNLEHPQKQPLRIFFKIGVLKNFTIFTKKHWKRLQHWRFPRNIAKFLRTAFL